MRLNFYKKHFDLILKTSQNKNLNTIYQWGVFNGDSMKETIEYFNEKNLFIQKYFGFDTFAGMPDENAEEVDQESWKKGGINAQKFFNVNSAEECLKCVYDKLIPCCKNTELNLFMGLAENTNNLDNYVKYKFEPALIIDADFDIYTPTKYCLDFYIKNKIIVEGTFIYYDDWGGIRDWENMSKGEPRAHKEICSEYNIEFDFLGQIGYSYPHIHRFYQVKKITL
jgi:hypothetical protein